MTVIENEWDETYGPYFNTVLGEIWTSYLYKTLISEDMEYLFHSISTQPELIPPWEGEGSDLWFRAFNLCPMTHVKVVILGQDPYHTPGAYDGLAFSNATLEKPQPSLRNILKEVYDEHFTSSDEDDFSVFVKNNKDLTHWAEQGVLLINAAQSVLKGQPGVHQMEWRFFTEAVIEVLTRKNDNIIVWMLWGKFAQSYKPFITNPKHEILESPHPSPFSADKGFFGNKHFVSANHLLEEKGIKGITWVNLKE